jgi:hypothetical protein
MKRLVLAAAVAAVMLVVPAFASANPGDFTIGDVTILGPVHLHRDHANVHVRYSCPDVDTHLWVSVKENDDATVDHEVSEEGAGGNGNATRWWMSHTAGPFTCDGHRHTGWFSVNANEVEAFGLHTDPLRPGWGYVQFCLTNDTNENAFVIVQRWTRVVRSD